MFMRNAVALQINPEYPVSTHFWKMPIQQILSKLRTETEEI